MITTRRLFCTSLSQSRRLFIANGSFSSGRPAASQILAEAENFPGEAQKISIFCRFTREVSVFISFTGNTGI
jgi:hypothetical protein